jgi:hypothetical protein
MLPKVVAVCVSCRDCWLPWLQNIALAAEGGTVLVAKPAIEFRPYHLSLTAFITIRDQSQNCTHAAQTPMTGKTHVHRGA